MSSQEVCTIQKGTFVEKVDIDGKVVLRFERVDA